MANIGQEAVINSELMISYKNDGQVINTDVSGDYEKAVASHMETM